LKSMGKGDKRAGAHCTGGKAYLTFMKSVKKAGGKKLPEKTLQREKMRKGEEGPRQENL